MVTGKAIALSAALTAWLSRPEGRAMFKAAMVRARAGDVTSAALEAGLALWRKWAADVSMTPEELAVGLAPLLRQT